MLDQNGFKRKSYADLLSDMSMKTKELFGADANVTERAFLGILIRIMAWFLSLAWMAIEQVYHAGYRKSAEGVQLDKLLPSAGITRNLEEFAYGSIEIVGTPNHLIESGFLVSTEMDITFETIEDIVLDINGRGTVQIVAQEIGVNGNVGANSIVEIVNPDANVTSVNNLIATSGGREKETDQEARARADITVEGMGSGTAPAIRAALLNLPSIRAAKVIENYTDSVDIYGTPIRAFQSFVLGGTDQEIGETILGAKAAGIQPYGTSTVQVADLSGTLQTVGFTRAVEIDIFANVTITTDASFGAKGINEVKNALVKYIGGVDTSTQIYSGLNMGDKVILAKSIAHVLNVPGVTDVEIQFSVDGTTFDEGNVLIDVQEVAQINANNIEVTLNV
ncbi:baseplate J/gp47 family protein [Psychrobacillus psychrotolerans]|uniref:baseplate J/gp47 family protein n=1 Tax=Psychrobacillus psychrotolerans TaxID=126156 RepID=UPI003B024C75